MEYFVQQLINGLTLGSIYGLIAIGYTMVFGIIGMVNFAHGDVFMLSTFVAHHRAAAARRRCPAGRARRARWRCIVVLVAGMFVTSLWNWAIEKVAYRPLRGSFRLAPLISAIGMSIFLMNFVQLVQGPRNKAVPPLIDGGFCIAGESTPAQTLPDRKRRLRRQPRLQADRHHAGDGVAARRPSGIWCSKTPLGRAQRACEQDSKMASLLGIDVDRTISITFVMGAALAAVAGVMYILQYGVINFADGFVPGVKAFTAAVLGGIGSLPGAVLGGLIIGLIEACGRPTSRSTTRTSPRFRSWP